MKKVGSKPKPKKIKFCVVHLKFSEPNDIKNLEVIKKLTGTSVATKAVNEALLNYPMYVKKSDALNDELMKVNRDFEQQQIKLDTVKRAFAIINDTK